MLDMTTPVDLEADGQSLVERIDNFLSSLVGAEEKPHKMHITVDATSPKVLGRDLGGRITQIIEAVLDLYWHRSKYSPATVIPCQDFEDKSYSAVDGVRAPLVVPKIVPGTEAGAALSKDDFSDFVRRADKREILLITVGPSPKDFYGAGVGGVVVVDDGDLPPPGDYGSYILDSILKISNKKILEVFQNASKEKRLKFLKVAENAFESNEILAELQAHNDVESASDIDEGRLLFDERAEIEAALTAVRDGAQATLICSDGRKREIVQYKTAKKEALFEDYYGYLRLYLTRYVRHFGAKHNFLSLAELRFLFGADIVNKANTNMKQQNHELTLSSIVPRRVDPDALLERNDK